MRISDWSSDVCSSDLYAEAQENAIARIRSLASQYNIQCDIESNAAYTYKREERYVSRIEKEAEVEQRLGFPATMTLGTCIPFAVIPPIRSATQTPVHSTKSIDSPDTTKSNERYH